MRKMISLYLEQTPILIKGMKKCYMDRDWKELQKSILNLISSFAIMGVKNEFEDLARKIIHHVNLGIETSEISRLVIQLENGLLRACKELEGEYHLM
jgi:hypothetical protein